MERKRTSTAIRRILPDVLHGADHADPAFETGENMARVAAFFRKILADGESTMTQFALTVGGIDRKEYLDACRESGRQLYTLLAVSMVFICGIIILFTGNSSLKAILWPVGIYLFVVVAYELLTRMSYKDQLAVIDPPVEYEFGASGWKVKKGDTSAEISWKATPRLRRTKRCLFLYNDDVTSNLLPLRLLTPGQINSIENWYKLSRQQAKEYQKEQDRIARKKFKDDHPGLRLGRTGPAWGPWKRRK